jgi:phage recombination protein Bet
MKTEESALIKPGASVVEFVPFGTKDKVQLSVEIIKRLVAVKTKTGKSCSDEDAFKFMLMCQARKLNPFEGDAFLIGYDSQSGTPSFSLITAHQAFLKRAELHPEFDGMDSGTIVMRDKQVIDLVGDWHMPTDTILGGWATVFFKNRSHPMHKRLRLSRFKKAYGIWNDDPAGMIVKCAEADALRSSFPTMLGGLYISEESEIRATEIARPVFEDTAPTGGKTVQATVVEEPQPPTKSAEPKAAPAAREEPKKKNVPPAMQRKSAARSTDKAQTSPRQQFADMLAVGKVTPQQFVTLALEEGWIDAEQSSWDAIPEERVVEFIKPDNFQYLISVIEEKAAAAPARPAVQSDKLL